MSMADFPSNSKNPQTPPASAPETAQEKEREKVEPVVEGEVIRRKKRLGKKFKEALLTTESGMSLGEYALFEVLIPSARKMFIDTMWSVVTGFGQGIEQKLTGTTTPVSAQRRATPTSFHPTHRVDYTASSRSTIRVNSNPAPTVGPTRQVISNRARAQHDFDELEFDTRQEATLVLESMYDRLERRDAISVADFYEFCNLRGNHTDEVWGWTNLHGAAVVPVRSGRYIISLPRTVPLN